MLMLTYLLIFRSLTEREKTAFSIQFNTFYQRDRVFYFQSLVHICIKVHLKTKVKVCHKKNDNYDLSIKSIQFSQLLIFTKLYIKFLNFKKVARDIFWGLTFYQHFDIWLDSRQFVV